MFQKILLIFLIVKSYDIAIVNAECYIEIKELIKNFQPVYIDPRTINFFSPITDNKKRKDVFQLAENQKLNLWCSAGWTTPAGSPNLITTTCKGGKLVYNKEKYNINDFVCKDWPTITYRRTGVKCFESGTLIDVGFQIDRLWFNIYTVCYDEIYEKTFYAHYNLKSVPTQGGVPEPEWEQTDFFPGKKVDDFYRIPKQQDTISAIFGDHNAGKTFIQLGKKFMTRGHMAAKSDFVYASHQRSTYHFINLAPQWNSFNKNWAEVEDWAKNAARKGKGLEVYTGTYGTLSLKCNSNTKLIFLDFRGDNLNSDGFGLADRVNAGQNRGNSWSNIGESTRRHSWPNIGSNHGQNLGISNTNIGGSSGQLFIPSAQNSKQFSNQMSKIPVPKFYYKILIDKTKAQAVAFFGFNNPYISETEANCNSICPNQNDNMNFSKKLAAKFKNRENGIICTCLVQDFLTTVKHVNLGNTAYSLLKQPK